MKFEDLIKKCIVDGAIDLKKMQDHEGTYGYNGGIGCDVLDGPCSCGAWHMPGEKIQLPDGRWVANPDYKYVPK